MEILKYSEIDLFETIKRSEQDVNNVLDTVSEILANVREKGDEAVKSYTEKFDGVLIDDLKVSSQEIDEAYDTLDDSLSDALKQAASNIESFHKKQIPEQWEMEVNPGITAGQIVRPINSAGCYIPGGRAAYPSSILMTVIPAKIAGVEKVVCVTPPQKDGKILDAILVAADISGADEIYKVGGAQAIGALAYGTESIPKVEKIVGPGNIFVTAAKKLVYGQVDIEFPAGPSEVLILADESAEPEFLATDILAQAEHDPNASCFLVTDSEDLAIKTDEFVLKLTENAPRREIIEESLSKSGKIIITDTFEEAIYVTNEYAPEHLIICTKDDDETLSHINNAGSIFLGPYSPVAAGDYGSGTNHVLPTGGGAKMYSGLSTEAFIKKPTVQRITKDGLAELSKTSVPIAEYEGFFAHANSFKRRLEN
ncbi:histidinol dehydrogenase [Methanobrevibacter millerae]|uniref:Histidinol dehydrogenase n=1 Tax=Methanobrevibacter millerae TaxID=230361 RepID=A0A1G5XSD4_9EURY|nr:histidinol dehydrogenase [Methanobrevibacter millerae]SDA73368.1 histidinol dehydrogenase [Methanobrevibacter millerae]